MAGFFPHTGIAYGDYTALSMSTPKSILDDICADISNSGGSVNGWSLYADYRTGSANTVWVSNNGRWLNQTNSSNQSWTFTSNSIYVYGAGGSGYVSALSFPYYNAATAPSQVSVDGVTWYSAWHFAGGFTGQTTASLDRPYAGATTYTYNLYMKAVSSIVLKCESTSSRDFYVELMMPASGNLGAAALLIRPWELYDTNTGSNRVIANYGQLDGMRLGLNVYGAYTGSDVQYVLCLYPDAFIFWAASLGSTIASVYYAGNLDTSEGAAISSDKGACWAGCSDTSYSGLLKSGGELVVTQYRWFGNSMMNRTVDEQPAWTDSNVYHTENVKPNATYQMKARGRAYCDWPWGFSVNYDGQVELLPLDIYQTGYSAATYYGGSAGPFMAREFFRGKLKYMKTFATAPISNNLATHSTAAGGRYICLRAGRNLNGRGSATPYHADEDFGMTSDASTAFSQPGVIVANYSEYSTNNIAIPAYGSILRYFAVPII